MILSSLWITVILILGGLYLQKILSDGLYNRLEKELLWRLNSLIAASEIREAPSGRRTLQIVKDTSDSRYNLAYSGIYYRIDALVKNPKQRFLLRSKSMYGEPVLYISGGDYSREASYWKVRAFDQQLHAISRDVFLPGSVHRYRFTVALDTAYIALEEKRYRRILLFILLFLGFGLLFLIWLLVTYGLSPLDRIKRSLADIQQGNYKRLDTTAFPSEIRPLIRETNALLTHIDTLRDQALVQAGNIAHALKTPMAIISNECDGQKTKFSQLVRENLAVMQHSLNHHHSRARSLGRRAVLDIRCQVWPALHGLAKALEKLYSYKDVTITLSGDRNIAFLGEEHDLQEIVGNLLDNACKYGNATVSVKVKKSRDEKTFTIILEDDGPGIEEQKKKMLLYRGTRLNETIPGSGLGLAIAHDLVESYNGDLSLEESAVLEGLQVVVTLPAAL